MFKAIRKVYFDVWQWSGDNVDDFKCFSSHYHVTRPEFSSDLVLIPKHRESEKIALSKDDFLIFPEGKYHLPSEKKIMNEVTFNNYFLI